jgi:hypothetical protein
MSKDNTPLGMCPTCGINRDIPGIGLAHNCRPRPVKKKLPPMEPLDEEAVARIEYDVSLMATSMMQKASNKTRAAEVQAQADAVKKRGRPATKTPEERKAAARERMRKRRAK